jgi:predicted HAD superfamily Cof-like phosphohydrolase
MSIFKEQAEFMIACGQTTGEYNDKQAELYATLILEEYKELIEADNAPDALKELMDLIVVLVGFGLSSGWDLDGAWNEVWKSNMSKIDPETGLVLKREDGKVLKPASYIAADVSKYV